MQIYAKSEKIIEIKKSRNPHKCVVSELLIKSDRRGSNPRSRPWQGRALPTTPLSHKRVMGIEPTYPAWKAGVLPLNYTRTACCLCISVASTNISIYDETVFVNTKFKFFLFF